MAKRQQPTKESNTAQSMILYSAILKKDFRKEVNTEIYSTCWKDGKTTETLQFL